MQIGFIYGFKMKASAHWFKHSKHTVGTSMRNSFIQNCVIVIIIVTLSIVVNVVSFLSVSLSLVCCLSLSLFFYYSFFRFFFHSSFIFHLLSIVVYGSCYCWCFRFIHLFFVIFFSLFLVNSIESSFVVWWWHNQTGFQFDIGTIDLSIDFFIFIYLARLIEFETFVRGQWMWFLFYFFSYPISIKHPLI